MMLPISTYDLENPASTARLVNCYAEQAPPGGRGPVILKKCPGSKSWSGATSFGEVPVCGVLSKHPANNEALIVWFAAGAPTSRRYILAEHGQIQAADTNFYPVEGTDWTKGPDKLVLNVGYGVEDSNEGLVISWSGGTTYPESWISDANFRARAPAEVEFLDNYYIWREQASGRFYASDVGDPTTYTSTSFATAEAAGDNLVGMKATRANLLLFGEETLEIWDAVGGGGFPFRRVINGAIDKGCANGKTVAEIDDQVLWLADDLTVRHLQGMEPVKVSNPAIDAWLAKSNSISSGKAFTYSWSGHNYYVLRFSNRCFVYDLSTGLWHERKTVGIDSWAYGMAENVWGKTCLGRVANPQAYSDNYSVPIAFLDATSYYEFEHQGALNSSFVPSVPMNMEWTYQPVWGAGQRVFHDRLEIVVQTGVGNSDETDPVVSLEASDDGGETWYSLPDKAMGAAGKTFQRVTWENLGSSYQRVYRASVSAPVPVTVISTELKAKGGYT